MPYQRFTIGDIELADDEVLRTAFFPNDFAAIVIEQDRITGLIHSVIDNGTVVRR